MNETKLTDEKLIGVEISGTELKAACVNKDGTLRDSAKFSLDPQTEIFAQLSAFLGELKTKFGDFKKIGIAVPGLLNRSTNRIALSKHIPEHTNVNLATEIKKKTGLEAVLENDANAAAYGEYVIGAGRGSRQMFYVTLGRGVGGAFVLDGKLWRGAAGFAGELGYIAVDEDGATLEEVASAESILRRVRIRVGQDSTSSLANIREQDITVASVVQAANRGDAFSRMMLERTGNYVGAAIANVINLFNIEKIVVGGEIMEAENFVLSAIVKRAKALSFIPSFATTDIAAGKLGEHAAAVGAALLSNENS